MEEEGIIASKTLWNNNLVALLQSCVLKDGIDDSKIKQTVRTDASYILTVYECSLQLRPTSHHKKQKDCKGLLPFSFLKKANILQFCMVMHIDDLL